MRHFKEETTKCEKRYFFLPTFALGRQFDCMHQAIIVAAPIGIPFESVFYGELRQKHVAQ